MVYGKILPGIFQARPNRFIAHVEIEGRLEVCHVKNTGRCRELLIPGVTVWLEESANPARKTRYDLIAVEKVRASVPGYYDLVLMDIQMPVMDGYEASRAIRALEDERLAAVPIVAMTANAFEEDKQAALDAGMNGHLAKPFDVDELFEMLASVIDR